MDTVKKPELPPCANPTCVALVIAEGFRFCVVHTKDPGYLAGPRIHKGRS